MKTVNVKVDVDTDEAVDDIDNVTESVEDLGTATKKTNEELEDTGKSAQKSVRGVKALGTSIGGLVKAAGVFTIILSVLQKLGEALSRNQKFADLFATAGAALAVVMDRLIVVVEPLAGFLLNMFTEPQATVKSLGDSITKFLQKPIDDFKAALITLGKAWDLLMDGEFSAAIETFSDGVGQAVDAVVNGVKDTVEKVTTAVKEEFASMVEDIKAGIEVAADITALENLAKLAEVEARRLTLVAQTNAEAQRQIRDDISKTFEERIAANNELAAILAQQLVDEKANAQIQISLAEKRLSLNRSNVDLQVELKTAQLELIDINERVEAQKSEQLTNDKALRLERKLLAEEDRMEQAEIREELKQIGLTDVEEAKLAEDTILEERLMRIETLRASEDEKRAFTKAAEEDHAASIKKIDADEKKRKDKERQTEIALDIAAAQNKLAVASFAANTLADLLDENTKAQKAAAITAVAIDTAQAIIGTWAGYAAMGPFGVVAAGIQTVAIAALAGVQIAKIAKAGADSKVSRPPVPTIPSPSTSDAPVAPVPNSPDSLAGFGVIQEAPRAWVLASDVSSELEANKKLERRAVLG